MFYNQESEYSFYLVGFLLAFCSLMAILFVPNNGTNRRRYAFIKTVRNLTLYLLIPLFVMLMLLQIYGFVTGNFITIQKSLWRLTFLIGGAAGYFISRHRLLRDANEGIKYFRRGSFNSGKFQKNFGNCRNHFVLLLVICIAMLIGQYLFMY